MFFYSFFDIFFVGFMVVLISLLVLVVQRVHLLIVLLSLEIIILGLFFFLCYFFGSVSGSSYISLVLLTFAACEASVGLSLLVALIRSHGKDFLSLFSGYLC